MIDLVEKKCICCGEIKPLDMFYEHKQMGDGHLNKCKKCVCEYATKRHYEGYELDEYREKERLRSKDSVS